MAAPSGVTQQVEESPIVLSNAGHTTKPDLSHIVMERPTPKSQTLHSRDKIYGYRTNAAALPGANSNVVCKMCAYPKSYSRDAAQNVETAP